jgi:hypothetical protein
MRSTAGLVRNRRRVELGGQDDPRLMFRPAAATWHVAANGGWFVPRTDADLDALLGLLPLEIADEQAYARRSGDAGSVSVRAGNPPTLQFRGSTDDLLRSLRSSVASSASVTWISGSHADGWVDTTAVLRVDGARRCVITAYLPESDTAHDKELAVQTPDGRRTVIDVHPLARGTRTEVELYRSRSIAHDVRLTLHTSHPEPVDDDRQLGFIVADVVAYR